MEIPLILIWFIPFMASAIAMAYAQQRYLRAYRDHHGIDRAELPLADDCAGKLPAAANSLTSRSGHDRSRRILRAYRARQSDPALERLRRRMWLYYGLSLGWDVGGLLLVLIVMLAQ